MTHIEYLLFQANFSCFIYNHAILCGEALWAVRTGQGSYAIFRSEDGHRGSTPFAFISAASLNKLAGKEITKVQPARLLRAGS